MFEQDYVMRLINEMVRAVLKLIFDIDTDSPSAELVKDLEVVLLFYSYLNNQSDEYLEEHDFSRDEVKSGLKDITKRYGVDGFVDAFLYM